MIGIRDPWVKAADKGMTAAFGTLANDGDSDVTLTSATTSVSSMELHPAGPWRRTRPAAAGTADRRTGDSGDRPDAVPDKAVRPDGRSW
ncbi:copper chaperone PCu(A)C [Micromonospora zamorensis]|uniref:copper chaperone PCu(A)C n=1 Tax=Micromonospora zamorensis TaxID=709883 RepID=UPI003D9231AF